MILEAKNITKTYGIRSNAFHVLKGIDVNVDKGEFVGIMGPSGAGKTTLLNVLASIDTLTDGVIRIDNQDISRMNDNKLSAFRREKLGFIFQGYNLLDTLTVKENILLPLTVGKLSKKEMINRLNHIAGKLGIQDILQKYPYEISGGQKQRAAAARAMIVNPAMIFADEPTGALDSKAATALLAKLEQLNKEEQATIMMVTHDSIAASYCSRVLFIKDGAIYHELFKVNQSREVFFKEIMKMQSSLGGDGYESL